MSIGTGGGARYNILFCRFSPSPFQLASDVNGFLRNESNIFSDDRGINQKRTENCINARSALLHKFSVLFFGWFLDQPRKYKIYFLSFNFHFISTKKSVILTLINAGLFPTFDVVEIHMTSQYSFSVDAKITSIF